MTRTTLPVVPPGAWLPDRVWTPSGEPQGIVICLGGFLSCGTAHYRALAERLSAEGLTVATLSLTGHDGVHEIPADLSLESLLTEVATREAQLLAPLSRSLPRFRCGFSLGALVQLLRARDDELRGFVIAESAPWMLHTFWKEWLQRLVWLSDPILGESALGRHLVAHTGSLAPGVTETEMFRTRVRYTRFPLRLLALLHEARRQARRAVPSLQGRVHLLHAERDTTADARATALLAQRFSLPITWFKDAGHPISLSAEATRYAEVISQIIQAGIVTVRPPTPVDTPKAI